MDDNALNFKETITAQATDYLMVARLENGVAIGGGYYSVGDLLDFLNDIQVIDNLTSTNTTSALSANQGKLLKDLVDAKVDSSLVGKANGLATLDSNGTITTDQLPSYVDDVVEYTNLASFPTTGTTGKIYVALDTNKTYRWSGTQYTEISASLAIGETTGTAYDGAKGKANAQAIETNQMNISTNTQNLGILKYTKDTVVHNIALSLFNSRPQITITEVD